jgi:anti-sigma regulatory factor (Ser/Thr protein kinase)/ABC-type transporter Mla MlaB component
MQKALLPASLPVLSRVGLAARYLMAGQDQTAGGDWFDAVPLEDGSVALIVGDIVGHGVTASAAMGQLRAVTNERLRAEPDLTVVLGQLDAFVSDTPPLRGATLAIVVLDPSNGLLTYATCGHPPPLIVSAVGVSRFLSRTGSGPLGTGSPGKVSTDAIEPGALVLLYSDGLVERPDRTLAAGKRELAAVAAGATNPGRPAVTNGGQADRMCQVAVDRMIEAGHADDVTVLAALRLMVPVAVLETMAPAQTDGLAVIRDAFESWLAQIDPRTENRADLRLAVTEIVTNAIEHAYVPQEAGWVKLRAVLRDDGNLECEISDRGRWRRPDPETPYRGNGLMVAGHVMDHMEVRTSLGRTGQADDEHGTTVLLRHRLSRPAVLDAGIRAEPVASPAVHGFDVTVANRVGGPEATVSGPVDTTTAGKLDRTLMAACRGGTLPLTINLSQVTHLASAGVRTLYDIRRKLADQHRTLTLTAAPASPAAFVLRLVGLAFTTHAVG